MKNCFEAPKPNLKKQINKVKQRRTVIQLVKLEVDQVKTVKRPADTPYCQL